MTQEELELETVEAGKERAARMLQNNEDRGAAEANPYASTLYRRYVRPLAAIIAEQCKAAKNRPMVATQANILLSPLDHEVVAYLAVRNAMNSLIGSGHSDGRGLMREIGKACYHELMLSLFADVEPDLFYTLVEDLGSRRSKAERYRMTIFKMQAEKAGIKFPEWGNAGVTAVGHHLAALMVKVGLLRSEMLQVTAKKRETVLMLSDEAEDVVEQIKAVVIETMPYYLPCIEQPKDWISIADGGFHTNAMRRMHPFAVMSKGDWYEFENHDMSITWDAMNALQRTGWKINRKVLSAIKLLQAEKGDTDEILGSEGPPEPMRPADIPEDMKKEDMPERMAERFLRWKRDKAEWFTEKKLRQTKWGRMYSALRIAEKFADFPKLYFVYRADFRGRLYPLTTGVSPQGSDMQKALLMFADGKPLDNEAAVRWFLIHGANLRGYDKQSYDERIKSIQAEHDLIMQYGTAGQSGMGCITDKGWLAADKPLQFLAWCFEYAEWKRAPLTFKSHLPVAMDGTCNGLQNFSAMLRDEVGGKATNLIPGPIPNDIYQQVAVRTMELLSKAVFSFEARAIAQGASEEDIEKAKKKDIAYASMRDRWLAHGLTRKLVKRSVMTQPYGSTRYSCADFIVEDYLKAGYAPEFDKREYAALATFLSGYVWAAIGDVVVKASEAMEWLQASAAEIIKSGADAIRWTSPSGFPVAQFYQAQLRSRLDVKSSLGRVQLTLASDSAQAAKSDHKNGLAPNMVHSVDAAHMALVSREGGRQGWSLAMVHDSFGTHAADAEGMFNAIRSVFVKMHTTSSPLEDLAEKYNLATPPGRGQLELEEVLASPYFFS